MARNKISIRKLYHEWEALAYWDRAWVFPQHRKIIDEDGENLVLIKPSKELPDIFGKTKSPRNVAVFSQENPATGIVFPSWRLLDTLQSDAVEKATMTYMQSLIV